MPLKTEQVNFWISLSQMIIMSDGNFKMDMATGVGSVTLPEHFTWDVMSSTLSPYGIVVSSDSKENQIVLDLKQLNIPENSRQSLETITISQLLIDDFLWNSIRKIQSVTGKEVKEVIPRLEGATNQFPEFKIALEQVRRLYSNAIKGMNDFIQKGLEMLTQFHEDKIEYLDSIGSDLAEFPTELQGLKEIKTKLESSSELSNELRYGFYDSLRSLFKKYHADLAFEHQLKSLTSSTGNSLDGESSLEEIERLGGLYSDERVFSKNDSSSQDASFESKHDDGEQSFLTLRLECCVPLQKFINDHPEPCSSLQKEKKNTCRCLIEGIKNSENASEIQGLIQQTLQKAKKLHKNPLGSVFASFEGDFQKNLKASKHVVDTFLNSTKHNPSIK